MGLFRTDRPVTVPAGLSRVLGARWLVVALVRYMAGTLRYDELLFGPPVRRGARFGLFVAGMWVDDPVSLWSGRCIWGLPKQMARFAWDGDTVHVVDRHGPVASLTLNSRGGWLPVPWLPVPGFGRLDGRWAFLVANVQARLAVADMRVQSWSDRFAYRPAETPVLGVEAKPFHMILPAPRLLDG